MPRLPEGLERISTLKGAQMLNVAKTKDGPVLKVTLDGIIDELADLNSLIGRDFREIHIHARDVTRINSMGIKSWRNYFHGLRCEAIKVRFFELPPELVSQINFVSYFVEVPEIETLCVPFYCSPCNRTTLKVYSLGEIRKICKELQDQPCEKCGQPAHFDEIAEEYFSFLENA